MGRISQMHIEMVCWDGISAVVRPLNHEQRQEADRAKTQAAIELAKGLDLEALKSLGESDEVKDEIEELRSSAPELDLGVAVKHGLVSYDGEGASADLIADLDARTFEEVGRKIVEMSSLDAAPLSEPQPAGSVAGATSQQS